MTDKTVTSEKASNTRRLAELHIIAARERALRLFTTTSTVFPSEWATPRIVEQMFLDASEFAFHARRVVDLCGFRNRAFDLVDQTRFSLSHDQDIAFISDFHEALNRLRHVTDFTFHWAVLETRPKVFLASPGEHVVSFFRVETDRREKANISVFGIAWAFLNSVIGAVKEEFPDYQF